MVKAALKCVGEYAGNFARARNSKGNVSTWKTTVRTCDSLDFGFSAFVGKWDSSYG